MPDTPVVAFDTIDSTNAEARRRVAAGGAAPCWLTAARQTMGRGRHGRGWTSEPGNLFATLMTPAPQPAARAAQLSFVAALAVADLVSDLAGARAECKWPNDVLIDGRKVAGILLESARDPAGGDWLVVGIGVNLTHAPTDTRWPATALGADVAPSLALEKLIGAWAKWRARFEAEGFAPIGHAWMRRAYGLGGRVTAQLGGDSVDGLFLGLNEDGAARLRLDSGPERLIHAGEIYFRSGQG